MTKESSKLQPVPETENLQWRFLEPQDVELVNGFYNDGTIRPFANLPGSKSRTAAQWQWEYGQCLWESSIPYLLTFQEKRLVGILGFISLQLCHNGQVENTEKSEDCVISPDQRGKRLISKMYQRLWDRACDFNITSLWGFTSVAVKPLLNSGFKSVGEVSIYRKDLKMAYVAASAIRFDDGKSSTFTRQKKRLIMLLKASQAYFKGIRYLSKPPAIPQELTVTRLDKADSECDRFSIEFSNHWRGLSVHFSEAYLTWRCFDNPHFNYVLFRASRGDKMIGLAICKLDLNTKIGTLSALAALPDESISLDEVLDALLLKSLSLFHESGINHISAWTGEQHPFTVKVVSKLMKIGFYMVRKDSQFMVRKIAATDDDCLDYDCWNICEIMSER